MRYLRIFKVYEYVIVNILQLLHINVCMVDLCRRQQQ